MIDNKFLEILPDLTDGVISLRRLTLKNTSENYCNWLNDSAVNEFLECRHTKHTKESVSEFITKSLEKDSNQLLLGIFLEKSNTHIGNIKLDQVNWFHKYGTIGLMIGDRDSWGKGFGTRAISLLTDYSIKTLKLKTLKAGCYAENIGSYRAFTKAGWKSIGRISNYWINNKGKRSDELLFSYEASNLEKLDFPDSDGFTLIGGGRLLIDTALILISKGFKVFIVLAPRHKNDDLMHEISKIECKFLVSKNINEDSLCLKELEKYNKCCLCFGPAWIFKEQVLQIYKGRIFNINRIPLPNYLGGAHFTWQILNQSLEGGAFIQQITENIDRGPIALSKNYVLSNEFRYPSDYEEFNYFKGLDLVKEFIHRIIKNKNIMLDDSYINWTDLTYFPRLNTSKNAWVNWQWSALEIQLFCNAFDSPYAGARSTLNGKTILIRNAILYKNEAYHSYCSGLIIRLDKENDKFYIAVPGGLLECNLLTETGEDIYLYSKLGDRLVTSLSQLESSVHRPKYGSEGLSK